MLVPEAVVSDRLRVHLVLRSGSRSLLHAIMAAGPARIESIHDDGPQERLMFVRHPARRLASTYAMIGAGEAFDAWLDRVLTDPMTDPHTWPQVEFIGPHRPTILPLVLADVALAARGIRPLRVNVSTHLPAISAAQWARIEHVYAADMRILAATTG